MEEVTPTIPKYKVISCFGLPELEQQTTELLQQGWQLAGPLLTVRNPNGQDEIVREFIRYEVDQVAQAHLDEQARQQRENFEQHLANMDSKVRDLLEVNNIELLLVDGLYYTKHDGKLTEGIDAQHVLELLKNSKHYPIGMKDETVINAIEGVV